MPSQKYTIQEWKMRMKAQRHAKPTSCEKCKTNPAVVHMIINDQTEDAQQMKVCRECKVEELTRARAAIKSSTKRRT